MGIQTIASAADNIYAEIQLNQKPFRPVAFEASCYVQESGQHKGVFTAQ